MIWHRTVMCSHTDMQRQKRPVVLHMGQDADELSNCRHAFDGGAIDHLEGQAAHRPLVALDALKNAGKFHRFLAAHLHQRLDFFPPLLKKMIFELLAGLFIYNQAQAHLFPGAFDAIGRVARQAASRSIHGQAAPDDENNDQINDYTDSEFHFRSFLSN